MSSVRLTIISSKSTWIKSASKERQENFKKSRTFLFSFGWSTIEDKMQNCEKMIADIRNYVSTD